MNTNPNAYTHREIVLIKSRGFLSHSLERFERGHWIIVFYLRMWILFWWFFFQFSTSWITINLLLSSSFFVTSGFFRLFVVFISFVAFIEILSFVFRWQLNFFFPCSLDIEKIPEKPASRMNNVQTNEKKCSNKKGAL